MHVKNKSSQKVNEWCDAHVPIGVKQTLTGETAGSVWTPSKLSVPGMQTNFHSKSHPEIELPPISPNF